MGMEIARFDIWQANLSPSAGSEVAKTRRFAVVSPNELNDSLETVVSR